jgi:hypothetical protein
MTILGVPPKIIKASCWMMNATPIVATMVTRGLLSKGRRTQRSTGRAMIPTTSGARMKAGQNEPTQPLKITASMAPSMYRSPWAMLMMPMTPKMRVRPRALSATTNPQTKPSVKRKRRLFNVSVTLYRPEQAAEIRS